MSSSSIKKREVRKFGLLALTFFGGLCAIGTWMKKPVPAYFFGFLSMSGCAFMLFPEKLAPIYKVWMKIAHYLGSAFTALILTIAYYLVITPSALLKRLFGGPPIPVKPDKKTSSYWVTRTESAQPIERFLKRY